MYASFGHIKIFKVLLLISVTYSWLVFQFDVEATFLHRKMDLDFYVCQFYGFEVSGKENWVWKLKKNYGMKQAPQMWKTHLKNTL